MNGVLEKKRVVFLVFIIFKQINREWKSDHPSTTDRFRYSYLHAGPTIVPRKLCSASGGLAFTAIGPNEPKQQFGLQPIQRSISYCEMPWSLYSLGGLLGDSSSGTLLRASSVTDDLGVDADLRCVSLSLGLVNAVSMGLLVLVVRSVVLRLSHSISIYYADYIK